MSQIKSFLINAVIFITTVGIGAILMFVGEKV